MVAEAIIMIIATNQSMHVARPGTAFNWDIPNETPAFSTSLVIEHILLAMMLLNLEAHVKG